MKKLLVMVFALMCFSANAQKWGSEFGLNYIYAKPVGGMGEIINQGHGATFNYGLVNPAQRFALGLDVSLAQYGRDKSKQEYTLDDGTKAPMDIIVSNSFVNVMAYARFYLSTEGLVRPFLAGKLGYSGFHTNLNIYDPDDFDHCEPLDHDVLYKDGTMLGAIGAGAKIDIAAAFKDLEKGRFYFEASFNYTHGGSVQYMNTDASTSHHHHTTPADADVVSAQFINTQTQIVHEHHVGYLYSNPVQMMEMRFGFSMNIVR